jgi:hypothetical protein
VSDDVPATLAEALRRLQSDLPPIAKSGKGQVGTRTYMYSNLREMTDALFPRLAELGLSFIAMPTMSGDKFVLAYKLLHVSGQFEGGEYPLALGTPQQHGSAITYGRRYCLAAVTGVAPEDDDDGAAASAQPRAARRPAAKRAPAKPRAGGAPEDQMRRMFALMKERGITAREDALQFCEDVTGKEITSRNDLTPEQVEQVIDALQVNPGFEEAP